MKLGFAYLSCLLMGIAGCATVSDEVSLKKIMPDQRVYAGRILVNFNGKEKPKCEIYLNFDFVPSLQLAADGFVFYKTDRKLKLRDIACHHQIDGHWSAWHHHPLALAEIERAENAQDVNYFGDIKIDWKIDPQTSRAAAQHDSSSRYPYKEGQVKDSGEIKLTVENDMAVVEKIFYEKAPEAREKGLKLRPALVTLRKE